MVVVLVESGPLSSEHSTIGPHTTVLDKMSLKKSEFGAYGAKVVCFELSGPDLSYTNVTTPGRSESTQFQPMAKFTLEHYVMGSHSLCHTQWPNPKFDFFLPESM